MWYVWYVRRLGGVERSPGGSAQRSAEHRAHLGARCSDLARPSSSRSIVIENSRNSVPVAGIYFKVGYTSELLLTLVGQNRNTQASASPVHTDLFDACNLLYTVYTVRNTQHAPARGLHLRPRRVRARRRSTHNTAHVHLEFQPRFIPVLSPAS